MDTKFEIINDDVANTTFDNNDTLPDYGGKLESDRGIDLNVVGGSVGSADAYESLSKSGFTRGLAGGLAGIEAISGVGGAIQPDYPDPYAGDGRPAEVQQVSPEWTAAEQERQDMIEQIERGEFPFELNPEYDDGKFNPDQQNEIAELGNAERGSEYGDHIDPPETIANEFIGEDLNAFEPLESFDASDFGDTSDFGDVPDFDNVPDMDFSPDFDF